MDSAGGAEAPKAPPLNPLLSQYLIPRLPSEWSYGILMTSVAPPDDLYLTGQYVNKSKL